MMHRWVTWIAPLLFVLALGLPPARGQPIEVSRGHSGLPRTEDEGAKTAALPYAVAFLSSLAVLVVVCMPTRKS